MVEVPSAFKERMPFEYPNHNHTIFEEYFYDRYVSDLNSIESDRIYLPIFWTSLYVRRNWGKGNFSDLQIFLDSLDRSKKYFTLVQYDEGILNDVSNLDLFVFSLAQNKIYDVILPTTCLPRPNINKDRERDIFCSSFGRYKGLENHPLHDKLISMNSNKYHIGKKIDINRYYDYLERSLFFICVNGYSPTTFKICECLQHGTIPVFLYDVKWIPLEDEIDFERFCVMISEKDIDKIDSILSSISEEKRKDMIEYGEYVYKNYYEYKSLYNIVLKKKKEKCI